MDDFRRLQKVMCANGAPNLNRGRCTYGCPCCRRVAFLRHFKPYSRRLAKVRFRRATHKLLEDQQC